ncbi:DNA repair protein RecO [Halotalea alkalilenta]|uniref:DNA repair protein RecO n=1 Tax=Halotalea alkalilenta TaxID=376489 RepID=A0A172YFY4_9GAMM|nr:DNA repair protein RecO [Halotalea alkalilenta]ANF57982.1 DNA repair protein RecO [Halotalea alkalilenta]
MALQPAFLLHRRPYRETSALVDLLTFEHGLVRGVARGVARPGSRSRGALQPFTPLHVAWRGERELKTLTLIESTRAGVMLAGEGLLCALYANELLYRCLPREFAVEALFAHYGALLEALPTPGLRAPGLRRLEITLLEALDAEPLFLSIDGDRPLEPQLRYGYDASARRFRPIADGHQGVDGRTLRLLAHGDWEAPGLAGAAKWLLREALAPLLGARPLRSRALLQSLVERRRAMPAD